MSPITKHSNAPVSVPEAAQPQTDAAILHAHPKIARRPANWKRPIQEIDPSGEKPTAAPISIISSHAKAWQDDPTFGIWLLAIVFILNIMLIALADSPETPKREPSVMIQQVTRESVLPTPRTSEKNNVRMFANPHDTGERTTRETIYDSIDEKRFTADEKNPSEGFEYDDKRR